MRSQIQVGSEFIFLQNNVYLAVFIFFTILGIGYLCWAYRSKYPSVIGLFVLVMIPLYFPSPITASRMAMITLRTDRFALLVAPFFASVIAIGCLVLLYSLYTSKYTRKIALLLGVLIFSYICFSALTVENASDCKDLAPPRGRVYFTEPELTAFNFVPQFIAHNSSVSSDKYASLMFDQRFFSETSALNLPSYYTSSAFQSTDPFSFETGFFVLRNQELEENGLGFNSGNEYGQTYMPTDDNLVKFAELSYTSRKIYDSKKVSILGS